jgi:hypothetical protein
LLLFTKKKRWFFFAKKNQKTFIYGRLGLSGEEWSDDRGSARPWPPGLPQPGTDPSAALILQ